MACPTHLKSRKRRKQCVRACWCAHTWMRVTLFSLIVVCCTSAWRIADAPPAPVMLVAPIALEDMFRVAASVIAGKVAAESAAVDAQVAAAAAEAPRVVRQLHAALVRGQEELGA